MAKMLYGVKPDIFKYAKCASLPRRDIHRTPRTRAMLIAESTRTLCGDPETASLSCDLVCRALHLGLCNDLDKTVHDNGSELDQSNLRGNKHGDDVKSA